MVDYDELLTAAVREGVLQALRVDRNEARFDDVIEVRQCVATGIKSGRRCKYPAEKGEFCGFHKFHAISE